MRRLGWVGLATLALLGGCARMAPAPEAGAPPARSRYVQKPGAGYDCTTHDFYLFTTSSCGDGGFRILSPATE